MSGVTVPVQPTASRATAPSHHWFFIAMALSMLAILTTAQAGGAPNQQAAKAGYPNAVVLYAAIAPHDQQLFVADGDGSNAQPLLAAPGYDYNASLSADGTWVTFTSERAGSPDIYRVRRDGRDLERLTDHLAFDDAGALSPDGRFLAFVSTRGDGNANIWVLDLASRELSNLTEGSPGDYLPSWSPDGEWIVFSSIRDSTPLAPAADPTVDPRAFAVSNLYTIRRNGTGVRRLTTSGTLYSPRWSPDGGSVAAVDVAATANGVTTRLVTVDIAEARVTELAAGDVRSPQVVSARRAAYASGQGIRFSDGALGAQGQFGSPSWSADGRAMVFHRTSPTPPPEGGIYAPQGSPTAFRVRPSLDPNFRLVRTGHFPSHRQPTGGNEIVVNNQMDGPVYNAILAVSPDGARSRAIIAGGGPLADRAMAPAVSPDGRFVVFGGLGARNFVSLGSRSRLALIGLDGSGFRELPAAGDYAHYPNWSPDGRKIVYMVGGPEGQRGLRILDLGSGQVTSLTTGEDNFPAWSPSGEQIAFTRAPRGLRGASQIYTVRPDGSDLRRLTLSPGAQDAHPAWSPDGAWIAFTSARINPRVERVGAISAHHGIGQIFVMRADGTDARQLTDTVYNSGTPAWLPGNRVP